MDPNDVLAQIRKGLSDTEDSCCAECAANSLHTMAEKFHELDEWLSAGGALPLDWADTRGRPLRSVS